PARPLAVGIGGTTAILALMQAGEDRFDRQLVEAARFSPDGLDPLVRRLWALSLVQRRQLPGLPPERADVILTGSAIYAAVMRTFGLAELRVSTRGLRFALLLG
ncbi:MAG: Ppx/GppA family phosphatase, partial [Verrucomicrobiota bacterium]